MDRRTPSGWHYVTGTYSGEEEGPEGGRELGYLPVEVGDLVWVFPEGQGGDQQPQAGYPGRSSAAWYIYVMRGPSLQGDTGWIPLACVQGQPGQFWIDTDALVAQDALVAGNTWEARAVLAAAEPSPEDSALTAQQRQEWVDFYGEDEECTATQTGAERTAAQSAGPQAGTDSAVGRGPAA